MSRHRRLQRTMRSPERAARRAKKRTTVQRKEQQQAAVRLEQSWLAGLWGGMTPRRNPAATPPAPEPAASGPRAAVPGRRVRKGRMGGDSRRTSR